MLSLPLIAIVWALFASGSLPLWLSIVSTICFAANFAMNTFAFITLYKQTLKTKK